MLPYGFYKLDSFKALNGQKVFVVLVVIVAASESRRMADSLEK